MNGQYCSTCGTLNPSFARFCQACGSRLPHVPGIACPACGRLALPGDRFCDECGRPLPVPAMLILDDSGWRVALPSVADRAQIVVGREDPLSGEKPDVDLAPYGAEACGVSRHHARLAPGVDGYTLEDLGSVNMTYVNDQRLDPGRRVVLKDGDRLVMGSLGMIFRSIQHS